MAQRQPASTPALAVQFCVERRDRG